MIEIKRPSATDLRWFGLIVAAVFAILGGVIAARSGIGTASKVLWGIGAALGILYYGFGPLRVPMYLSWMHAVAPIGWVVSHLMLGIVFFGIVTPVALIMRALGRDALHRGFDPGAATYWRRHDSRGDVSRYLRQT